MDAFAATSPMDVVAVTRRGGRGWRVGNGTGTALMRVPTSTTTMRRAGVRGRRGTTTTVCARAFETSLSGNARGEEGAEREDGRRARGWTRATAALLVGVVANASFGVAVGVAADGTMVDPMSEVVVPAAASAVASAVADDDERRAAALDGAESRTAPSVVVDGTAGTAAVAGDESGKDGEKDKSKPDRRGKMKQLQELRSELEIKELELQAAANDLQKSDQTVQVLQQELELKNKLLDLMRKDRDKAIEEAQLASGLCAQVGGGGF
jgi:hypothetical protein